MVTVVFADLVGSTAAAERSDPEDVRAMLAAHHARVRVELERFGGTVEKFIGDAVVAVFGAPVVHEDDPERAVRAALAIRDAATEGGVELRVAVNTGEALVALDARPSDGEGMVAGDVVNTAARIQSAAPVNGVLVGETTYRATAHVIEYRDADPVEAKGKAEPVPVWEAVAPRSRFGSDVDEAPLAMLVGRDREVDQLRDALTRAREEREPQLVTLVGVPGIGKSRLVAELFGIVDDDPDIIVWRQGRCLPYGEGISYWALGEMAKSQAGVLETDSAAEATAKLTEAVGALITDPTVAQWVTGHLKPLVGLGTDARVGSESGEAFAAWRRFFESMGEQRPTVLVFEDLHWADDGLLDFVDGLVDRATGVPLLVLCSARPELLVRRPGWSGGKANAATLSLAALSEEDTARLIAEHLAQAVLPAEMQRTLLRRADGNPLFAEEYIRMLRDRGLLRREGETWLLDTDDVDVPETVQGIIAARLDALEVEEKELLQAASVVGKVFWLGSVAAIAGVSTWEAEERLHALERKELVRRDRRASVAGETEYAVRHVLVRDVAYGQIPRGRRADLHVRAAAWIESLGADRAEDRAEMLAHHYVAALDLVRAAGGDAAELELPARLALREAGVRAHGLNAFEAAVGFYRRALELWPHDDAGYPHLLFQLGKVLMHRTEGEAELRKAGELLLAARDLEGAGEAESCLGELAWHRGQRQAAFAHFGRSLELVDGLPETGVTARIRLWAWRTELLANRRPSLDEGRRILALLEQLAPAEDVLHARVTIGLGHSYEGEQQEALRMLEGVREDALRANSHVAARAMLNLASLKGDMGELRRSAELHREGREVAQRFSSYFHERWLEAECLLDDFFAGEWERAARSAQAFLEQEAAANYMDIAAYYVLAATAAARGDRRAAAAHNSVLLTRARAIGDAQALWPSLGHCACAALEDGDSTQARVYVDELAYAMATAESLAVSPSEIEAFIAAEALGREQEIGVRLANAPHTSPWVDAGRLIVEGRLDEAGDVLYAHEAFAQAAQVRLRAAERAGRETPGLREAIAFYESVGATACLARAERLLQATA